MNKLGWGGEGGREEEASEMHGPRKSTCMLLSLSLLEIYTMCIYLVATVTCHVVCSIQLWSVDLRICVTSITFASTFRISSHAQN